MLRFSIGLAGVVFMLALTLAVLHGASAIRAQVDGCDYYPAPYLFGGYVDCD